MARIRAAHYTSLASSSPSTVSSPLYAAPSTFPAAINAHSSVSSPCCRSLDLQPFDFTVFKSVCPATSRHLVPFVICKRCIQSQGKRHSIRQSSAAAHSGISRRRATYYKKTIAMALKAAQVFELMGKAVDEVGPQLVPKVKGVIKFDVTGAGFWIVDLKNGNGKVAAATESDKADIVITLSEANFLQLIDNKLNPQQAFMKGLIKIKGNMGLAMKLNVVVAATRNFIKKNGAGAAPAAAAPSAGKSALKSAEVFRLIASALQAEGPALAKKVNGVIQFNVTPGGAWNLDLKSASPSLTEGEKKADVTITVGDDDFIAIATGKLNAQQAFMKGKLKLKGNMALAMKLPVLFNAIKPKAKL
ncbi:Peroxisomal multifunctional enzyme type 2, partial [Globisporangium splendens]